MPVTGSSSPGQVIPDGGYGWVVVAAAFMTQVLCNGFVFTIGKFYAEFLNFYQANEMQTSIVGALLNGMQHAVGKLTGKLIN